MKKKTAKIEKGEAEDGEQNKQSGEIEKHSIVPNIYQSLRCKSPVVFCARRQLMHCPDKCLSSCESDMNVSHSHYVKVYL